MKHPCLFFLFCCLIGSATAQPNIQWEKTFGGSLDDLVRSIQATSDGGFIMAGSSQSVDGDVSGNHGDYDCWVVKINQDGLIEWQKSLGGSGSEGCRSIIQTSDGGYMLGGGSYSNDGDVSGNHGDGDFWLVKLDESGNLLWQKTLGGSKYDLITSLQQTNDGGFIAAGFSKSNDGDVSGHHGSSTDTDLWVGKLSAAGSIEWQNSFGGTSDEEASSIRQTSDGGYIVGGTTYSNDGDVIGNHGITDFWLLKLSAEGQIQWQRPIGGSEVDFAMETIETSDGGFIATGYSKSEDGDVNRNPNEDVNQDYWIVKLSQRGAIQWKKSLGSSAWDNAVSIRETSAGEYIIIGDSRGAGNDVTTNFGKNDLWVIGLNDSGTLLWEKSLGSPLEEIARAISLSVDGELIIAGLRTFSFSDHDLYVVKLNGL